MLGRHVQFGDLSGRSISAVLPANSTVGSACAFLAEQLMVARDDVRIVDTGALRDSPYCSSTSQLPPSPVCFQIVTKKDGPEPESALFSRFARAQRMGQMWSSVEYASYGSTPSNYADCVERLTLMGFSADLVEDTLRIVNFDVAYAVDLLSDEALRRELELAYVSGQVVRPRDQVQNRPRGRPLPFLRLPFT
jgi:hypothetical protein